MLVFLAINLSLKYYTINIITIKPIKIILYY